MSAKLILLFTLFILFFSKVSFANKEPKERVFILSGKIKDVNHNELLAGVSITSTTFEKTMYSDLNGNFFIYFKVKNDKDFKLEFSQIGYITKTLTIADLYGKSNQIEIELIEE